MADPKKPKRTSAKSPKQKATVKPSETDTVEDAVVIEEGEKETLDTAEQIADAGTESDDAKVDATSETHKDDGSEKGDEPSPEENASTTEPEDASTPDDTAADTDPITEPVDETHTPATVIAPAPEPKKRGGVFPLILGGVIAAGLGAGALYIAQDRGWLDLGSNSEALIAQIEQQATQIEAQDTQLGTLETSLQTALSKIDELAAKEPDLTSVTTAIDALQQVTTQTTSDVATVTSSVAALDPRITELNERIKDVELQPIPKAELPAEVTAAYERQLADMLASVDTRFGELEATQATKVAAIETTLNDKITALETAQAAAVASEEELAKAASLAAARSAMSQIEMALDSGAEFAEALQTVTENTQIAAPDALSALATDGAPTLVQLKTEFPAVARDALAAATRDAAAGGDVSPLSAFLRTQLGARSLAPREGDDPDAVLSRAEAAVASANLDEALTEIAALPQTGQDILADWVASATARRAALEAAAALSAQIDTN